MPSTAKLFMNGRSQAVRLPKEFRFEGDEVEIRRDPVTGGVLLLEKSRQIRDWQAFFEAADKVREEGGVPEGFPWRDRSEPEIRPGLFDDWDE